MRSADSGPFIVERVEVAQCAESKHRLYGVWHRFFEQFGRPFGESGLSGPGPTIDRTDCAQGSLRVAHGHRTTLPMG